MAWHFCSLLFVMVGDHPLVLHGVAFLLSLVCYGRGSPIGDTWRGVSVLFSLLW